MPVEIELLTKNRSNLYQGFIVGIMSTLDFSFNNLIGEIPPERGQLSSIFALNLSHNQLNGSIPKTFSNLTQLESLEQLHQLVQNFFHFAPLKPTFSILHTHFYKTTTSVYLFYTFIQ